MLKGFANPEELNAHEIIIYPTAASRTRDVLLFSGKSDGLGMAAAPAGVLSGPRGRHR